MKFSTTAIDDDEDEDEDEDEEYTPFGSFPIVVGDIDNIRF